MNDRPLDLSQGVSQVQRQRHPHAMPGCEPGPPCLYLCALSLGRDIHRKAINLHVDPPMLNSRHGKAPL